MVKDHQVSRKGLDYYISCVLEMYMIRIFSFLFNHLSKGRGRIFSLCWQIQFSRWARLLFEPLQLTMILEYQCLTSKLLWGRGAAEGTPMSLPLPKPTLLCSVLAFPLQKKDH